MICTSISIEPISFAQNDGRARFYSNPYYIEYNMNDKETHVICVYTFFGGWIIQITSFTLILPRSHGFNLVYILWLFYLYSNYMENNWRRICSSKSISTPNDSSIYSNLILWLSYWKSRWLCNINVSNELRTETQFEWMILSIQNKFLYWTWVNCQEKIWWITTES